MSLECIFSIDAQQLTVSVDEIFDFGKVQNFCVAFSGDIENVNSIVIDLGKTEYMDSSALGMLLNMQKLLSPQVTTLNIVNCRPQVVKIL